MRRYVAEFKVVGEASEPDRTPREANQVITKERTFDAKTIGKGISTGVGLVATSARLYSVYQTAQNAIVGDSVAQRQFDNRMAYLNEGLTIFGTLGVAAIVNPATLPLAAVGLSVNYGLRAYQTAQQNQVKQAHFAVERMMNEQRQARLVRDITGIRV